MGLNICESILEMGFSDSFKEVNIHGIIESVMRFLKSQFGW